MYTIFIYLVSALFMSDMDKEGSAGFMNDGDHSRALHQDLTTVSEHLPQHKQA